jgi:hypothetical protein
VGRQRVGRPPVRWLDQAHWTPATRRPLTRSAWVGRQRPTDDDSTRQREAYGSHLVGRHGRTLGEVLHTIRQRQPSLSDARAAGKEGPRSEDGDRPARRQRRHQLPHGPVGQRAYAARPDPWHCSVDRFARRLSENCDTRTTLCDGITTARASGGRRPAYRGSRVATRRSRAVACNPIVRGSHRPNHFPTASPKSRRQALGQRSRRANAERTLSTTWGQKQSWLRSTQTTNRITRAANLAGAGRDSAVDPGTVRGGR